MANEYASNFGDVVKHAVLCEALTHERPARYVESHGGRLDYDLAALTPGRGGAWDFLDVAGDDPALRGGAYARLLLPLAGRPDAPGIYPGSVSLADALLPADAEIVAFDLVAASAASLEEGLAARGRRATVTVGDGLAGTLDTARKGDLVLLDPFHVTDSLADGPTAVETFALLADHGVATLLWYGVFRTDEPIRWTQDVRDRVACPLWRAEYACVDADAGLAGCGVLGANLAVPTEAALTRVAAQLGDALATRVPGIRYAISRTDDRAHPIWQPFGPRHP